ncbi:MAG: hypothetical protein JNL83_26825 [Myxococcales bacterium]|nr:hypothetical protein [Myxococcales bacterium]
MRCSSSVLLAVAMASAASGCLWDLRENEDPAPLQVPTSFEMTAECGKAPKFFPFMIYNHPDKNLTIVDANVDGGFSVIDPLPVVVPRNQTGALTIVPPPAVVGTDHPHNLKTGTLLLGTSEGNFAVDLLAQIIGSELEIADSAGRPLTLAFSGSQCPAPITAKLTNWGNVRLMVSAPTPSAFRIEGLVSGTLEPGETRTITVRPYTTSACTGTESLLFTATGALCSVPVAIEASFNLTGSTTCTCP